MWQHVVNCTLLRKYWLMFYFENSFRKPGIELILGALDRMLGNLDFPPAANGKSLEAGQQESRWS